MAKKQIPPIFVNHRKADTEGPAERLASELRRAFGDDAVFFDRTSIRGGDDWKKKLRASMLGTKVMLALIGEDWWELDPELHLPRLDNPKDWVRIELEAGLEAEGVTVIPVQVDDAALPTPKALARFEILQRLDRQAMQLRVRDWDGDFAKLCTRIVELGVATAATSPASPTARGATSPADFAAYRAWLRKRHDGIELRGVGSGDIRMPLEEVFVPLRLDVDATFRRRRAAADDTDELLDMSLAAASRDRELFVENVFAAEPGCRHALLFGEPGTGKTTAVRKLILQCLDDSSKIDHLDESALPVLISLRRLRQLGTDASMADLIGTVLHEESDQTLPKELGAQLWHRGHLLLLLDGLDEVADETMYDAASAWITRELGRAEARTIRAVVTCRVVLRERIDLGDTFAVLDVKKLRQEQCELLVRKWYDAAARQLPNFPAAEAKKLSARLIAALNSEDYSSQQVKVLVGTPLLLTLLCVVALREGEMPRHRVTFYRRCLEVLLEKWRYRQHAEKPLLELEDALAVLRTVAHELQPNKRRDNLTGVEFAKLTVAQLKERRLGPIQVLTWLLRETGVLVEFATDQHGFMHQGLQEFLCAEAMALRNESAQLASHVDDPWWKEVTLLHVGLRERQTFAPWCTAVLARNDWRQQLAAIHSALLDAHQPDLAPLLEVAKGKDAVAAADALQLLAGRNEAAVLETARGLLLHKNSAVRRLAQQIVDRTAAASTADRSCNVLVIAAASQRTAASDLTRALRGQALVPWLDGEDGNGRKPWLQDLDAALQCTVAIVLADSTSGPWRDRNVADGLAALHASGIGLAVWQPQKAAKGWNPPTVPHELLADTAPECRAVLNWVRASFGASTMGRADIARPGASSPKPGSTGGSSASVWIEPTTGIRFVAIKAGDFERGERGLEHAEPVRLVHVPGFWLAETPVTNAQYAAYLAAAKATEPPTWRETHLSHSDQPVVGVSWADAQAFCAWLSSRIDVRFRLPSEAEWEYAARAGTKTPFSFRGDESQLEDYGWFAKNAKGQPHAVRLKQPNPWGLSDMHGNVWEWCEDAWSDSYEDAPADGSARVASGAAIRVIRGGSCVHSARSCRSAFRNRIWPHNHHAYLGFRPAWSSPDSFTPSPPAGPSTTPEKPRARG